MSGSMIGDRSYLRGSCWFVTGNASACSLALDSQLAAPPIIAKHCPAIYLSVAASLPAA